jgi:hypothetical protein
MAVVNDKSVCCLCGQPITDRNPDSPDALSMDHIPPRQFFPKFVRANENPNLWKVPTHKRCNGDYKLDEEYFYHNLNPLVQNANGDMGAIMLQDLRHRASKPQTQVLIRSLLNGCKTKSPGGVLMPPGTIHISVDAYRVQRVATKIACGLFYRHHLRFMPRGNCKDIRLCESPKDVPEMYTLSWHFGDAVTVCPKVFSYRTAAPDGHHFMSLLFWEAFIFCMAFDEPNMKS